MRNPTPVLLVALAAAPAYAATVTANPNAAWPAQVFAPYVDLAAYPTPQLSTISTANQTNYYTLAFLTANQQQATWGGYAAYPVSATSPTNAAGDFGYDVITGINAVRAKGGDVMASFGGAAGTPIDATITSPAKLVAEYQRAIDTYQLRAIDFDVEGSWVADAASIARRSAAIATLQQNNPGLKVWYTLATTTAGLDASALAVLRSGLTAGARIDGVNVMAMDYYDGVSGTKMGDAAITAATATHGQLKTLFNQFGQSYTDAQLWARQGITPMIGLNDDTSESFTVANAQQVLSFAQQNNLGYLGYWNATRDHPGTGGVNETDSGIAQSDYQFAKLWSAYNTTSAAANWSLTTGGSWAAAANWSAAAVPAAGASVTFGPTITTAATVTLDGNRSVARLTFNTAKSVTIAQGTTLAVNTLTLSDPAGAPAVTVTAGSHTIAAPLSLSAGATVTTATGTALTLSGNVSGSGPLTIAGPGTTTIATTAAVSVPITVTGSLAFAANPTATPLLRTLTGLTVSGTATVANGTGRTLLVTPSLSLAGRLDLGTNDLLVPAGNLAAVTAMAARGFAGGAWTGTGLGTSAAAANRLLAVGVIPNSANGTTPLYASFDGRTSLATDVLARATYYGDANLDGRVDAADYTRLDAGYLARTTTWFDGDFNYDGTVDASDYTLADNAFNHQTSAQARPTSAAAAVPEPAAVLPLAAAAAGLLVRRRR